MSLPDTVRHALLGLAQNRFVILPATLLVIPCWSALLLVFPRAFNLIGP